jgi:hypothetical protein
MTSLPQGLPKALEDAAYVSVGLGVLALQRAQVRRRELERHLVTLADAFWSQEGSRTGPPQGPEPEV